MSDTLLSIREDAGLKETPDGMDLVQLCNLYSSLERLFPGENWKELEPETVELHLGVEMSALLRDKIEVLKLLLYDARAQTNPTFIIHACNVINNDIADFDIVPLPSSLHLAYYVCALADLHEAAGDAFVFVPTHALTEVCKYTLVNEGYSVAVPPFTFIDSAMPEGQSPADTAAKISAITQYVEYMRGL